MSDPNVDRLVEIKTALGPKKMAGDTGSVEEYSVDELKQAAREAMPGCP